MITDFHFWVNYTVNKHFLTLMFLLKLVQYFLHFLFIDFPPLSQNYHINVSILTFTVWPHFLPL